MLNIRPAQTCSDLLVIDLDHSFFSLKRIAGAAGKSGLNRLKMLLVATISSKYNGPIDSRKEFSSGKAREKNRHIALVSSRNYLSTIVLKRFHLLVQLYHCKALQVDCWPKINTGMARYNHIFNTGIISAHALAKD